MRIGIVLDHMAHPGASLDLVRAAERGGCDEAWVPETWGFDAPSLMGAMAACTDRIRIGAVLPVYSRSPALIAQTFAGVDALSAGRAIAGLGTSGPQVVEGWHGVPFARPLGELREVVFACRTAWRREVLEVEGPRPVPLPPGEGTGMGTPLRMITRPERDEIPVVVAALAPGGVRLAAELADAWWPLFASPGAITGHWSAPLAYVGSMGSRERNYYRDAVSAMGFAGEAAAIADAALAGRRRDAEALVPDAMVEALAVIGDGPAVAERLAALADAGVTTLALTAGTPDPVRVVESLGRLMP